MKKVLTIMTVSVLLALVGAPLVAQDAGVTITIVNRGASAWVVSGVEGASGVAETGTRNPTLTLRAGVRYRIRNEADRSVHPFELISTNGGDTVLLSQIGDVTGSFEDDADVDFQEGPRGITFTMTSELLEAVTGYRCEAHPRSMRGTVQSPSESGSM